MINFVEDIIKIWIRRIIGLIFLSGGLYMVLSNNYSKILIIILSIFSLRYWWKE